MSPISFSFLRKKRFTKGGRSRGISLIELTIGIAILVLILGITILTVTNRATTARMESYASTVSGYIQQEGTKIAANLRGNPITEAELAASVTSLFTGIDDIATGGPSTDGSNAGQCPGTTFGIAINTRQPVTGPPAVAGLTAGELSALSVATATAVTRVIEELRARGLTTNQIFDTASAGTVTATSTVGTNLVVLCVG